VFYAAMLFSRMAGKLCEKLQHDKTVMVMVMAAF
jgi:hypothetical protein